MSKSATKSEASTMTAKSTCSYKKKSMKPIEPSKATESSKKQLSKSIISKNLTKKQGPKLIVPSKAKHPLKKHEPKLVKGAPVKKQPIETKKIPPVWKVAQERPIALTTRVQPETKIINRNFYEEVSASDKKPDDREYEDVAPPTSDLMPAKKKTPESDQKLTKKKNPEMDSERNGSKKKPENPYQKVTPRDCVPDRWEGDPESESDRKPPKKKKKKLWSERKVRNWIKRHACKVAMVLLVVFVLAGVSCTVVFVVMRGKGTSKAPANQTSETELDSSTGLPIYEGQAATFFEGACMQRYPNVNRSCLAGSPPASCNGTGTCTHFAYRVKLGQQAGKDEFLDERKVYSHQWPATVKGIRQLCKTDQDRLGVCSEKGQCDHLYKDQGEGSWYANAEWEDSCDIPNPCWNGTTSVLEGQPVSREECRNKTTDCDKDQDASVWMQHLRCKIGKNRTISGGCTGLPMRLWLCKSCKRTRNPDCSGGVLSVNLHECSYTCQYPSGNVGGFLPNGRNCTYSANPEALAYCFRGQCFPVHDNVSDTKPMNLTECNRMWTQYDAVNQ